MVIRKGERLEKQVKLLKIIIIVVVLTMVCHITGYSEKTTEIEYDFRKTRWGMTSEEVKASEYEAKKGEGNTYLKYEDTIAYMGMVNIRYEFLNGKLFQGNYKPYSRYAHDSQYAKVYKLIRAKLVKKYGEPVHENIPENFESGGSILTDDVKEGLLVLYSEWETETTIIQLSLRATAPTFGFNFSLKYSEKGYGQVEREKRKQKEKYDF